MKKKLQHQEQHEHEVAAELKHQSRQEQTAREFATAEEAIRADAAETEVPPAIAERLQKSLDANPPVVPEKSWWRKLFD
jgi:negative regulator of sigma E activity